MHVSSDKISSTREPAKSRQKLTKKERFRRQRIQVEEPVAGHVEHDRHSALATYPRHSRQNNVGIAPQESSPQFISPVDKCENHLSEHFRAR
jgi:hypothetical protein